MRTTQIVGGAHFLCGHCITRHSLRYFRHSGLVIYISKLPAPSVSMPCDYRILQSPTKGQVFTCPFGDRPAVSLCENFGFRIEV